MSTYSTPGGTHRQPAPDPSYRQIQPSIRSVGLTKSYPVYEQAPGLAGAVRGLFRRRTQQRVAVSDLDLEVPQGQILGLLGPNGASKTTTIKMMCGLLRPTSGDLQVLGREPGKRSFEFLRSISVIFGQKSILWSGGGLLGYGLWAAHVTPSPMSIVLAAAWLVLGMAGYSLFWANLAYLAFWMDSAEPVNEIALQLRSAGQYPLAYYPDVARSVLCTVVPASLIGALPVTVLAGTSTGSALIWAFVAISIVATATYAHWVFALRRYASASS